MANDTLPQVQALRLRVALLDTNGVPHPGAGGLYCTDQLVKVAWKPVYEDGAEITRKNGSGQTCVNYRGPDSFKRADVEITLCAPNPALVALLTGGSVLTNGSKVGFATPYIGALPTRYLSLEWWTIRVNDGIADPDYPYCRWVAPMAKNLRLSDKSFEDDAQDTVIQGQLYENSNWYNGPTGDWPTAVATDKCLQSLMCTAGELPGVNTDVATIAAS